MGERKVKLILNKSGMGNINPRIPIPYIWFQILGFNKEEYEAELILDEEKKEIIVRKTK